jgi:hypothetical protein
MKTLRQNCKKFLLMFIDYNKIQTKRSINLERRTEKLFNLLKLLLMTPFNLKMHLE